MLSVIITILVYSLILTIVTIYKDNSGYYICGPIDVIFAGPVMWAFMGVLFLLRPLIKKIKQTMPKRESKPKSEKEIEKIVSKIIKNYKKYKYRDYHLIDLSRIFGDDYNSYDGWKVLMVNRPRFERINRKFESLMYGKQEEQTVEVIKKYCELVNPKNVNNWCIQERMEKDKSFQLYKVKM